MIKIVIILFDFTHLKLMADQTVSMETLLKNSPPMIIPTPGEIIEGSIIDLSKNRILVDIEGVNIGVISGREARDSTETSKTLQIGDKVHVCVLESENEEGFVVLSLRKASQERAWKKFMEAYEKGETISVKPNEANKGGLLLEVDGIKGFIPVSQLAPMHYPRVNGADANLILEKLRKLISLNLSVKIINIDKDNGKLILSERAAFEKERRSALKTLKVNDVVDGKISGVVKFGIFVAFEGLEGLVHISEIAWGHVKNPLSFGRVGDPVKVQIIGIDGEKISLSMKRLTPDPWAEIAKNFKIGSIVKGEINRLAPFGAFMKLSDDINGLIHLSELIPGDNGPIKDPAEVLTVGQIVEAKVIDLNLEEHRIGLSIKALTNKEEKEEAKLSKKTKEKAESEPEIESEPKSAPKKKPSKKGPKKDDES
ncbi:MAG: RNA binding S1 domain-containing protein, small subunit ribosomal protein S1 [Candidatus Peregrinibacteria bacterium GW2011_GWE2_39_6]|nr:MAG: RNA binding S1 domain-containing protein, small subunit ribosomal protein S1 [Candidatus Peregrinibacteria bacterium GW2011_GWF2_39_17]KKR26795.1 MAG: RNA binding S1 domain-containing protein, small subunit ribosomal protein S1 [Candidatus Peregrinibacteria bacterium GW2011_GWE2_39_6]